MKLGFYSESNKRGFLGLGFHLREIGEIEKCVLEKRLDFWWQFLDLEQNKEEKDEGGQQRKKKKRRQLFLFCLHFFAFPFSGCDDEELWWGRVTGNWKISKIIDFVFLFLFLICFG